MNIDNQRRNYQVAVCPFVRSYTQLIICPSSVIWNSVFGSNFIFTVLLWNCLLQPLNERGAGLFPYLTFPLSYSTFINWTSFSKVTNWYVAQMWVEKFRYAFLHLCVRWWLSLLFLICWRKLNKNSYSNEVINRVHRQSNTASGHVEMFQEHRTLIYK